MSDELVVHINHRVRVKLTDHGEDVWLRFLAEFTNNAWSSVVLRRDEEGYVSFTLWELMRVFGSDIGRTEMCFEGNEVRIPTS